jgi:UDP-N-acetylglucosamine--N-acetylmuramyl-(pentapeptide) pyrophosphoryl-undecaprenol N-acetylglucosamine transferase
MKKIMFCGGGSAGHVIPNMALCDLLKDSFQLAYIGTNSIEKDICKANNITFFEFESVKYVRRKVFCNLKIPIKLAKSISQCKKILEEYRPDLLFCKGGYVSVPPAFAAKKLNIPVITHESDLTLGLANRLIGGKCKAVLTTFQPTAKKVKNGIYVGSPMRQNLFNRDKISSKQQLGLDMRPTILVFGGGSGSQKINFYLRKSLTTLHKQYNILHICGKGNVENSNLYGYKQLEFANDMGEIYACADYAIARCGSNSANELIALKIPTLFIPLENKRSRGDQLANANYFKYLQLCHILRENELNTTTLQSAIQQLISDKNLKTALAESNCKCGNQAIIDQILLALK